MKDCLQMSNKKIGAVILGAGLSVRMEQPKLLLSWAGKTVIEQIVEVLQQADVKPVLIVAGRWWKEILALVENRSVRVVFHPHYAETQMMQTILLGLDALEQDVDAAMIVLGDQPQVKLEVVSGLVNAYQSGNGELIVPSYHMRRGHPWLMGRELWQDFRKMETSREFLKQFEKKIHYLEVETDSILQDLDTPEDYQRYRPD